MAATGRAAGGNSPQDLIDLYGDLSHNNGKDVDFDKTAEASDLYDAVLTGLVSRDKELPPKVVTSASKEMPVKENNKSSIHSNSEGLPPLRLPLYIGNFPWWTSDTDIINMAQTLGVKDVLEIKFVENRANGQSRGFAEIVVSTEESMKKLLEKIPQCQLNGERVDCRFATRQNYAVFEAIANKRIPQRVTSKDSKEESDSGEKITTILSQESSPPPVPPVLPPNLPANKLPSLSNPFFNRPPPLPNIMPNIPPPPMPHMFPPPPLYVPSQPPPNLHINPAFFPPGHDSHSSKAYSQQKDSGKPTPPTPNRDFEELMNRNRAVASSAITKAVSGATAGDLRMAMETLLTAIAVIKQSRVYGDERCQTLVTSLKDCLVSIQGNYSSRSRNRSRSRDEERDWDREYDRERERDREDSYSTGWEGAGASRGHRERSSSGERDRERMRDRDRHREYRDRYR